MRKAIAYNFFTGFTNTFQLIAFLLSVFNIAQSLNANANNNNNNNNLNDNKANANENDINESNANSEVMAMNMIMPGRNIPFPVEARMVESSKGTKNFYFKKKKRSLLPVRKATTEGFESLEHKADTSQIILDFLQLWLKLLSSNSKDCQRKFFCEVNEAASRTSLVGWTLAEVISLGIARLASKSQADKDHLVLSGQYGRAGLNCTQIYQECNVNEQRFVAFATQLLPWSPVGELRYIENLVAWALMK